MLQRVQIPSPVGPLEGILEMPPHYTGSAGAVVAHPHPLYGGTMRNKVVARLAVALLEAGAAVVRFNFRGVEGSGGAHDRGDGERDDVLAALDFLGRKAAPRVRMLAGFSFGAWVSARVAVSRPDLPWLLSVGSPLGMYDYRFIDDCPQAVLFVQGDRDEFGSVAEIAGLCRPGQPARSMVVVKGADHFFTGRLRALQEAVCRHYQPFFAGAAGPSP
jgi:hypothetical protein